MTPESISFLGYKIFTGRVELISTSFTGIINTINPYSYFIAKKDSQFQEALQQSDMLVPDGIGIIFASKILNHQTIKRITGSDIHKQILAEAQKAGLKVFYLGAGEITLRKIKVRINLDYPSIKVCTYSPPYKPIFSGEDTKKMIESINSFAPDILFVGMTAPKQEKWVNQNKSDINAKIICSVGAVFDFFSGTINRAPNWMLKNNLEWLWRLVSQPQKIIPRSIAFPVLIFDAIKYKNKI